MQIISFWTLTALCTLSCLSFLLLPILAIKSDHKYKISAVYGLCLPLMAYSLYFNWGASHQLVPYYSQIQREQRANNAQIRPLNVRLRRALVKNKLNLLPEAQNLDLILNFASIQSKLAAGVLPLEIRQALENILKIMPNQITALNLLAVHSYKSGAYTQAIAYWQKILLQITPDLQVKDAVAVLNDKILEARSLESRQTNIK